MGEFDRARTPASASLLSGAIGPGTAANRMRGQATAIWRMGGGEGNLTYGASGVARAGIYLKRVSLAWGIGTALWDMARAVIDSMTIEQRMVADLAAAHTFAAWVFAHRQAPFPYARPASLRASQEAEDARGNHNIVTSEQFAQIWRTSVLTTRSKLDRALGSVNLDALTAELRTRMGDRAQLHTMSRTERLGLLRVMMAGDFDHSPRAAATVYHMANMDGYGVTARGVAASMMQASPYRGAA